MNKNFDFLYRLKSVYKTVMDGKENKHILSDISLNIREGEFLGIQGESGSGKSTLLNILGGIDKITDGQIIYGKSDISNHNSRKMAELRRSIGFVFQSFQLIEHLNVQENISIPLMLAGKPLKERQAKAIESLQTVNLKQEKLKQSSKTLSGGEQQRVAIARAIVHDPKVILADEPTGNLDSSNEDQILELFYNLHNNNEPKMTIILVSHSYKVVRYCDRVLELADGKIVNGY